MKIAYPKEKIEGFSRAPIRDSPVGKFPELESSTYKKFQALLYLGFAIEKSVVGKAADYGRECLSDSSSSFLQFYLNLNKSSLVSLRSAIENALRFLVQNNGKSAATLTSVPDLVSEARSLNLFEGSSTKLVNEAYALYQDLCEAVHSSNPKYLSDDVPFRKLTSFVSEKSQVNLQKCESAFGLLMRILFISDPKAVAALDHKHSDFVLDNIPRSLKKAVSSEAK